MAKVRECEIWTDCLNKIDIMKLLDGRCSEFAVFNGYDDFISLKHWAGKRSILHPFKFQLARAHKSDEVVCSVVVVRDWCFGLFQTEEILYSNISVEELSQTSRDQLAGIQKEDRKQPYRFFHHGEFRRESFSLRLTNPFL